MDNFILFTTQNGFILINHSPEGDVRKVVAGRDFELPFINPAAVASGDSEETDFGVNL